MEDLHYDQLVVALGSVSRTLPIPGLAEHGVGFKSLPEAIALRNHVLRTLEVAETLEDPAEREPWLTYVFVGAGYAGLEGLAELQDFAADVIDLYPRCRTQGMRWILVEARERVMPEIPADLAEFATRELRGRGHRDPHLDDARRGHRADRVTLSGGEVVPTRTLVWTAGVKPHPVVARLGLPLDERGPDPRRRDDARRRPRQRLGDRRRRRGARPGQARASSPRRRPPSTRSARARASARNVAAAIGNGRVKPFRFKTKGVFVDMGQGQAVATTLGITWRGVPAWWLARSYHLAMLPGTKRKLRLLVDWNVQLLFGRDASELGGLGRAPRPRSRPDGRRHAHRGAGGGRRRARRQRLGQSTRRAQLNRAARHGSRHSGETYTPCAEAWIMKSVAQRDALVDDAPLGRLLPEAAGAEEHAGRRAGRRRAGCALRLRDLARLRGRGAAADRAARTSSPTA